MKKLAILLYLVIPLISNTAGAVVSVSDLSPDRCTLKEVISILDYQSIQKISAIAQQSLAILNQLEQLNKKAKSNDKPLNEQLSPQDLEKVSELDQQLKTTQLADLMESRRQRDLHVIAKMVMISDRDYRWQDIPSKETEEFAIYSAVQLLRLLVKNNEISTPQSRACSLEVALHLIGNDELKKLSSKNAQIKSATAEIKEIQTKYGIDTLDRSLMSKLDAARIDELYKKVINPLIRIKDFVKDIENIKLMAKVSEFMYESNKQDISFGGGDVGAIGKTIDRQTKNGELDDDTKLAIGIWTKINEKIPSDTVKGFIQIEKSNKKVK